MGEVFAFITELLGTIGVLVIQYFLVKQPRKWLGFILPAIYFVLSMKSVISVVQSGEIILGSMIGTVVFIFLAGNFMTLLLLIIWWKRNADKSSIVISIFLTWLICGGLFTLGTYFAVLNQVLTDEELNPSPNIGNRIYIESEDTSADYPVMLEDLGVEPMLYRYTNTSTMVMPNYRESEYVDSMVDDIENTTKIVTIDYEIRVAGEKELDSREKTLKKRSDDNPVETTLDYGANASYWLGDSLLLRYDDCIVYFQDSSSRSLLESETAAEFFQNEFEVPQE